MQVSGMERSLGVYAVNQDGKTLPVASQTQPTADEKSYIHQLAQTIDPHSVTRNELCEIGAALARAGDQELASEFFSQSLILHVNQDGSVRTAMEDDPIMNEQFDMFESLDSQMEFNRTHGISNAKLEAAKAFMYKLEIASTTPNIDAYT